MHRGPPHSRGKLSRTDCQKQASSSRPGSEDPGASLPTAHSLSPCEHLPLAGGGPLGQRRDQRDSPAGAAGHSRLGEAGRWPGAAAQAQLQGWASCGPSRSQTARPTTRCVFTVPPHPGGRPGPPGGAGLRWRGALQSPPKPPALGDLGCSLPPLVNSRVPSAARSVKHSQSACSAARRADASSV